MDHEQAQRWLDAYREAWLTYDASAVAGLFAENVAYRYHPSDEPVTGREAVVRSWMGEGDGDEESSRDAPGTYDAAYAPVAVDGDVVVATGSTWYREVPEGPTVRTYDNCFVMRFDTDGACREFTEFYVRRPA